MMIHDLDSSIRSMRESDWPAVARIYEQGIKTGDATFETEVPSWTEWHEAHLKRCRLVAEIESNVIGFAALSPVSGRCVYDGVAEVSVYVAETARGHGIGSRLLGELVTTSEREGLWTLEASIFPENEASIHIHKRCGFRKVGVRERLGTLNGHWRDVVLLERRSQVVGV